MQNHNELGTSPPMDQLRLVSALYIDPELNLQPNLLGLFPFLRPKKCFVIHNVKIKYDNEGKKRRQERKKEVGALMAGHLRLVTQPVLNPADRT